MADSRTHPHTDMPSVDKLTSLILAKHPAHHDLYLAAHRLILETVPDLRYSVDLTDAVIGYGQRQFGYDGWGMAALSPHKKWVSLILFRGAHLDAPAGLLEGTGPHMRHLKLRSFEDFDAKREVLTRLIADAATIAQRG
ncbi:MAG: DUF1801 domain-containing protein [Coriobacteriia bacterium]|nr:DUF1801 domain-containing protein [Coriobacteriia bacterium]